MMETNVVEVKHSPLTKEQMLAAVRTVQEVMRTVMKDGEHYGVVPGCGNKPTLLKAGSEKLLHTFGFGTEVAVEDMFPGDTDRVGYRVTVTVRNRDGRLMGSGVGEASSEEAKWKWREAVCQEEWDEKMDDERRKKWKGNGECVYQIKNNPYDVSNTILKMAKKRAQIDATLTVCACSDIFAQDLEEMAENGQSMKPKTSSLKPTGITAPKYGKFPGKPLSEVDDEWLEKYANNCATQIDDPAKAKFKASNTKILEAIIAEQDKRKLNRELDEQAAAEA